MASKTYRKRDSRIGKKPTRESVKSNGGASAPQAVTNVGSIRERAMLANLSISAWDPWKYDKEASRKTEQVYQSEEGTVRSSKTLVPKDCEEFKKLCSVVGATRKRHYELTQPWSDSGPRILATANYFDYSEAIRKAQDEINKALQDFFAVYPDIIRSAPKRLNGLYRPGLFPSEEDLKERYKLRVQILPLPAGSDFRVDLDENSVKAIRESIEADTRSALEGAQNDAIDRMVSALSTMVETLKDPERGYHESLFGNVKELCELLPKMNVLADPRLEPKIEEIRSKVLSVDPKGIKKDQVARDNIAKEARKLATAMKGFMF